MSISLSGVGVPYSSPFPTSHSLWNMHLIPPVPSLEQSIVGQPMITSQLSMYGIQSSIGPNLMFNLVSGFLPSSSTLESSLIMSIMCYPFGWNWNTRPTFTHINMIGSVSPSSGIPFPGGSNDSRGLPFLVGNHAPRSIPLLGGSHLSCGLPFPNNFYLFGSFHFPRGTYPPSNVWK